jgi:HAD superfamily hydrolase (TIGR01509 family)
MTRAIIFDCFGVLVHTGFHETYRRAGGDPVTDADFIKDILGQDNMGLISSAEMQDQIIGKIGISPQQWLKTISSAQSPNEDVLAWAAKQKGKYKLAILSNANRGTLNSIFSKAQLDLFETIVVSADVGVMKPSAEIYELVASNLGLKTSECLFTDDIEYFCTAAEATGMKAVHFKSLNQFIDDSSQYLNN